MGLTGIEHHNWVNDTLHLIDKGLVKLVIWQLNSYQGQGQERIANLSQYLKRFSDAVHYETFLAQGLSIGSGEVESAHRYIPPKAPQNSRSHLASRYSQSNAGFTHHSG